MAFDWKVFQYVLEVLVETDGPARCTQIITEYIQDQATRSGRVSQVIIEYIEDHATRLAHCSQIIIEVAMKPSPGGTSTGDYLDEASAGDFAW